MGTRGYRSGATDSGIYSNAAWFMGVAGDYPRQRELSQAGVDHASRAVAPETTCCWGNLFVFFQNTGDWAPSIDAVENAYLASANASRARAGAVGGWSSVFMDKAQAARKRLNESLAPARGTGNTAIIAVVLTCPGGFEARELNFPAATERCRDALRISREHFLPMCEAAAARYIAFFGGQSGSAHPVLLWVNALETARETRMWISPWGNLENLALGWMSNGGAKPGGRDLGQARGTGRLHADARRRPSRSREDPR